MAATHENRVEEEVDYVKDRIPEKWLRLKCEIKWQKAIITVVWHVVTFYFVLTFPYRDHKGLLLWALVVADLNLLGVTGGAHRLWSHRSFKAKLPLRVLLAVLYYGAGQASIHRWVKHHRLHHKYTDTDADPYSSARGFFFSHIGWIVMKKHPDYMKKIKGIDTSDFFQDKVIATMDRHCVPLIIFFCFVLPVAVPVYLFNSSLKAAIVTQWFMRHAYVQHTVFSINSFAHSVGYHSYNKSISSTENRLVSLFCTGEGWHNYHHVFPWDYKAAELNGVFLNRTTAWLNFFKAVGWAYDMKEATPESVKKAVELKGDGSHPLCAARERKGDPGMMTNCFLE